MAVAIQELCLQAVQVELQGLIAGMPGLTVERGRPRPFEADDVPALNQLDGLDEITDYTGSTELHEIEVDIEGYLTDADPTALQTASSDFQAKTWQAALAAQADPNIILVLHGGVPRDRDDEAGAPPQLAFTLTILVKYQTARNDPYSIG